MTIPVSGGQAEAARLEALRGYRILDTPPEQDFDDLVELAAAVCDSPVAAIAFVDGHRSWLKAKRGVEIWELPRDTALSAEALLHTDVFEVSDARSRRPLSIVPGRLSWLPLFRRHAASVAGGTRCRDRMRTRSEASRAIGGAKGWPACNRAPGDEPTRAPASLAAGELGQRQIPPTCRATSRCRLHRRSRRLEWLLLQPAGRVAHRLLGRRMGLRT